MIPSERNYVTTTKQPIINTSSQRNIDSSPVNSLNVGSISATNPFLAGAARELAAQTISPPNTATPAAPLPHPSLLDLHRLSPPKTTLSTSGSTSADQALTFDPFSDSEKAARHKDATDTNRIAEIAREFDNHNRTWAGGARKTNLVELTAPTKSPTNRAVSQFQLKSNSSVPIIQKSSSAVVTGENSTQNAVRELARAFDGTASSGKANEQSALQSPSFPGWVTFDQAATDTKATPPIGAAPAAALNTAKQQPPSVPQASSRSFSTAAKPIAINTMHINPDSFTDVPEETPYGLSDNPFNHQNQTLSQPISLSTSASTLIAPPVDQRPSFRSSPNRGLMEDPLAPALNNTASHRVSDSHNPFGDEFDIEASPDGSEDENDSGNEKARLARSAKMALENRLSKGRAGSAQMLSHSFGGQNRKPTTPTGPGRPDVAILPASNRVSTASDPFAEDKAAIDFLSVGRNESPSSTFPNESQNQFSRPAISPQRPPLPPRPQSPMHPARAPASSSILLADLPPPIAARPIPRAVEDALQDYVISASGSPPRVDPEERFVGLRREKAFSPNSFHTNRRPPLAVGLPNTDIYLKNPTRCFAISGFWAATGTDKVRIWYIPSGENMRTVTVPEAPNVSSKVYAMAFVPTQYVEEEGRFLWISLEGGVIVELDISIGTIVDRRVAHGATVTHIMRHGTETWTLDDAGGCKVWTQGQEGRLLLGQRPRAFRASPKQVVAYVAGAKLWCGSGRVVEVYWPREEASSSFLGRWDVGVGVGNVTCFTGLMHDPGQVVSGHDDGKIILWSAFNSTVTKIRIITTGVYRVTALLSPTSQTLWAGFSTGKIHIYDLTTWTTLKDFPAYHSASIQSFSFDHRSTILSSRCQIASLSDNGQIRLWDGFLTRDWVDSQLRLREHEYSTCAPLNILMCSYNLDASKPTSFNPTFLSTYLSTPSFSPDIIVVGFQELVDLESKKVTAKQLLQSKKKSAQQAADHRFRLWREALVNAVRVVHGEGWNIIECKQMVGLFQCVFVRGVQVADVEVRCVKTGLGGLHGNKGGISTRFLISSTSLCFINSHLAAHQNQVSARNNDITTILTTTKFPPRPALEGVFVGGGDGEYILDHENVFWGGDLNYRIDLPRDRVLELIDKKDFATLRDHDQLLHQMLTNPSFGLRGFSEGPLDFAPTFKYDVGHERYDTSEKRRVPSWCDRVLYRSPSTNLHTYTRHDSLCSDHRPIRATFTTRVKTIEPKLFSVIRSAVEQELSMYIAQQVEGEKVRWLCAAGEVDPEKARSLLREVGGEVRLARDRLEISIPTGNMEVNLLG